MRALAERVNARVGAARTVHGDVSSRDLPQCFFEDVLNGVC